MVYRTDEERVKMKYNHILHMDDNMVVLFVDIIGFSEDIKNNITTTQHTEGFNIDLAKIYNDIAERYSDEYQVSKGIKFLWVSDSIFITCEAKKINNLLNELDYIINQLYCLCYAIRGGISLGKLYFEKNLWGTAVLNAVNHEKIANYPRIIICKDDFLALDISEEKHFKPIELDGFLEYNYFTSFLSRCIKEGKKYNSKLNVYSDIIENKFKQCTEANHKEKWAYLAYELAAAIKINSNYIILENEKALERNDGSEKRHLDIKGYLNRMKCALEHTKICKHKWEISKKE